MTARESILNTLRRATVPMTVDDMSHATGLLVGTIKALMAPMFRAGLINGRAREDGAYGTVWSA